MSDQRKTNSIIAAALKLLPAKTPAAVKNFLADFYARVPTDDLKLVDPALMAETALLQWEMSVRRKAGTPAVQIRTISGEDNNPALNRTVIDIVNDDMAFLVDSVAAEIGRNRRLIRLLLHPILQARHAGGKLTAIDAQEGKGLAQSHMHIQLQGAVAPSRIPQLTEDLTQVLKNVGFATRDWLKMRERLHEVQGELAKMPEAAGDGHLEEYTAFLDYLYRDNFTLLGYRSYDFVEKGGKLSSSTVKNSSLGLLRDEVQPVFVGDNTIGLPHDLQIMRRALPPLVIAKVNRRSPVHRPVPMDAIAVKRFDKGGKVIGEDLFIGLFTSVTYSRSIQDIPLLRHKADAVLMRSGFRPGSHNFKALRHILEKFPRDEICQMEVAELETTALSILRLQERQRIALYMRRDPFRRYVSCLVYIPRDRYDRRLRNVIKNILEQELHGTCDDFQTNLDDSALARIIFTINTDQNNPPKFNIEKIEALLQEAGRAWSERLGEALLAEGWDDKDIPETVHEYGEGFPAAYRETYLPKQAVFDIVKIKEAAAGGKIALELYRDKGCGPNNLRLKVYQQATPIVLSDILPVLENMGLRVLSELPFEVRPLGAAAPVWIHDFMTVSTSEYTDAKIDGKEKFEEALSHIWDGRMENDSLNNLVLSARMDWREIMILRTYVRYLKQTRSPFSTAYVERTLFRNAAISRQIIDLFKAQFDPDKIKVSEKQAAACLAAIEKELEKVTSLEEDRILRSIANLVSVTLRTNFYQPDKDGNLKPYLAVKLDSKKIDDIPDPKPYREIFVYSTRVEGVHLRADVIARGGIRWSDRFEDFRTEVLGLMKAQQVKNAIIVPMGAKGGFIVKKPPTTGGRAAYLQEGIECYKLFIRNLLEITDNRVGRAVVPPPQVVRRDMDDPYLVVAADKGTATFSDIANGLSAEFGFWLGDAFASGGSAGYDHKKIGITARGAWESVKRHFREVNIDTQTQLFDCLGVGDMAGDVFGNGMLMSEKIRLVGAFNHVHIFCDPDPDAAKTFKERKRLFDAVKGWEEYDQKLLSKGGRIYSRADKSLQLSPEIMKRFGLAKEKVAPSDLIQAILRAEADLLFFGGIGTYLKASYESHADVGDKSNDALRIDASEVRAKAIGEGANLAVTQNARIEFAKKGGRLNADFIDNSGGVNCSDMEVNIKILLNDVMSDPKNDLSISQRNSLLERMTDEVAQLVLRNNYQQVQGISLMEYRGIDNLPMHARMIDDLERFHDLSRRQAGLPEPEDIAARIKAGQGLTRPELAVLQAHSKILLTCDILASDIPDMPEMEGPWLFKYFPAPLRTKYEKEIRRHRLKREIIATTLTTSIVNRMGPVFVRGMMDKTGATSAEVAKAYEVVREAFELDLLWSQIEALDNKTPAEIQMRAMRAITQMAEREISWFLTRLGRRLDMSQDIKSFQKNIGTLRGLLNDVVTPDILEKIKTRTEIGIKENLPLELAERIAGISALGAACDITRISLTEKADIKVTARIYYELGSYFHLHWLRQQARAIVAKDRWTTEAVDGLIEMFYSCQAGLTKRILGDMKKELGNPKMTGADIVGKWLQTHGHQAAQFAPFFAEVRRVGTADMPILMLTEQRLRQLQN